MPHYQVHVEQTIEATVEVEADTPYEAEVLAETRAEAGDYDDWWEQLAVDANYSTFGPVEITEAE
jgi:hypothetical protein